jgi:hypothetical protein
LNDRSSAIEHVPRSSFTAGAGHREAPTRLDRPSENPGKRADELGWPDLAHTVDPLARDADVIVTLNYAEAGALEMNGRGLPVVASGCHLRVLATARRRPELPRAGFKPQQATICRDYRMLARIRMPADNEEQARPIAHCTLDGSLSSVWPRILAVYE